MSGDTRMPLPQLTFDNEFFWTSGADGILRIQQCRACSALIHPPQPVCRYCRGRDMGVREVSGTAVLSAFTVNHRFSIPGLAAPYVVAQVALTDDPRIRLTTNIIDAAADELEIGQLVEVVFEQNDDVYLHCSGRCPRSSSAPSRPTRSRLRISVQTFGRWRARRSSRTSRRSPASVRHGWAGG